MDDAVVRVADKVQTLSDLELAALLCLVAEQHAIIEADAAQLDVLTQELQLIAGSVFGLSSTVLECSDKTTLDGFGTGLLVEDEDVSYFSSSPSITRDQPNRRIANVVIAKNLNHSHHQVQTQALEVCFKNTMKRDNNQFFISHYHHIEDGFPNLQEYRGLDDDQASMSSVVRPSSSMTLAPPKAVAKSPLFPQDVSLHHLLRGQFGNALAPLHGLSYVPPSLVALATRKIYPHRIVLTTPENERSMQWGSSLEAVREVLDGVTVDDVIEDVLHQVEVPL
ncbi:hypothetical protein SLS56_007836 [Neofusicoccum ribis]|uniref:Magnesium chelatase n=1 Tax=Neofusicoccum ribis TaxID=45134 RepID=A0ABR3SMN4_9PEZI